MIEEKLLHAVSFEAVSATACEPRKQPFLDCQRRNNRHQRNPLNHRITLGHVYLNSGVRNVREFEEVSVWGKGSLT